MKKVIYTLIVIIMFCPLHLTCKDRNKVFSIKALLIPSGPYDGSWRINIEEFPDSSGAELSFSRHVGLAASMFSGKTILNREKLKELKSGLSAQKFFELPDNISANVITLHKPDYSLEVCSQSECRKVNLYDPVSLEQTKESTRFISAWNLVLECLPKWPSNWPLISPKQSK
ncbi:MAG: hypothetical protein ACPGJI_00195 [Kangiellaceae bacterium]